MRLALALARVASRSLDLLLIALIVLVVALVLVTRVVPFVTGGATFVVAGGSMEPTIPVGAVVMPSPVASEELAVGDVVSLKVGEKQAVFTHRITRLVEREGARWLETKGDANERPDPAIIPATAVIGRVDVMVPYAGYAVRLLGTAQGILLLLALGVLTLAGGWLLDDLALGMALTRHRATLGHGPLAPDGRTGEGALG